MLQASQKLPRPVERDVPNEDLGPRQISRSKSPRLPGTPDGDVLFALRSNTTQARVATSCAPMSSWWTTSASRHGPRESATKLRVSVVGQSGAKDRVGIGTVQQPDRKLTLEFPQRPRQGVAGGVPSRGCVGKQVKRYPPALPNLRDAGSRPQMPFKWGVEAHLRATDGRRATKLVVRVSEVLRGDGRTWRSSRRKIPGDLWSSNVQERDRLSGPPLVRFDPSEPSRLARPPAGACGRSN